MYVNYSKWVANQEVYRTLDCYSPISGNLYGGPFQKFFPICIFAYFNLPLGRYSHRIRSIILSSVNQVVQ
jgi:hypothetical protein